MVIGVFLALSAVIAVAGAADIIPIQVHLALTGNTTQMAVSWFTRGEVTAPAVRYGTVPGQYPITKAAIQRTFNATVGYTQDAVLTDLAHDTKYYYIVGSDDGKWSREYNFTSPSAEFRPFTVPMYGDYGVRNSPETARDLASIVLGGRADFIFHVGDISYANDYESERFEEIWDAWFDENSPYLPYIPYMVCPGNHEYHSGMPILSYSTDFTPYRYRFRMPWQESGSTAGNNMWYSFDYHNVHFVAVSTETDFPYAPEAEHLFGDQLTWLRKDLAATKQPWIIVGGHRPMYSASKYFEENGKPVGDPAHLIDAMEEIFHEYKVDMFVVGHVHSYERQYPTYRGALASKSYHNPPATVHIVAGSPGCEEGISAYWNDPRPDWNAYRYPETHLDQTAFGYGMLHVYNNTHIEWQFVKSADKEVIDSVIISKS